MASSLKSSVSLQRSEERTRARVPLAWAKTQNDLGIALSALGERASGTARLEEAVTAHSAALEERTRARVPREWGHDPEQPRHRAIRPR